MNLPEEFIKRTKQLLGKDWELFEQSLASDVPSSIRINPSKYYSDLNSEKVLWSDVGYYLPERPNFTFDPLFHAGCYYPQEASSMFIEQVFRQYVSVNNLHILDLCAAPGGKSTHILSLIGEDSLLVANEVIRSRATVLSENITKCGASNAIVTNNDPSHIGGKIKGYFDVVMVDAPCSGEGMFRKQPDAVNEWSVSNVNLCKERQQRIVADIWDSLKPDGILIYSTCTYNTEENEENVHWISQTLDAEVLELDVPSGWNVTGSLKGEIPVYRFFPHRSKGEGFTMAVLRKRGEASAFSSKRINRKRTGNKQLSLSEDYRKHMKDKENFHFISENSKWIAVPSSFQVDYELISSSLKVISAGTEIGQMKGKDFIPSHGLAMSVNADLSAFMTYDLDWLQAIAFLRKETIILPDGLPKGYIVVTYRNVPLGFVKNIGNRANNLYPQDWRIRSPHLPDKISVLDE